MKTDSLGKTVLKIYEELVKSNIRKDFYVDGVSGDDIDGNGEYFKPFKSVSKASRAIISILCGEVVDCQKPA